MTRFEAVQTLAVPLVPAETLQPGPTEALSTPPLNQAVSTDFGDCTHAEITRRLDPAGEQSRGRRRHTVTRAAARVALVGYTASYLLLGGARPAEAAAPDAMLAQALSQESGFDWNTSFPILIAVASLAIALQTNRSQRKEKREDRFIGALQDIKGESTGEDRTFRLRVLSLYAKHREYAPQVFISSVEYLRGRRGGLDILRNKYKDNPQAIEQGIAERRNADRGALGLFLATLPAARKQGREQGKVARIKKRLLTKPDELQTLDELTGTLIDTEEGRVDARGINLDDMRDLKRYNFSDVDLTGAGLQRNQITNVIFRNSRLCEAQLEGTIVSRSDFRQADLRAAYLAGATFEKCVIDRNTQFGNLPDGHPDAKFGSLRPDRPDDYRGDTEVILKDLISDTLSQEQIVQAVHAWQRNGLKLLGGSNHEYFLNPDDDPNHLRPSRPVAPAPR